MEISLDQKISVIKQWLGTGSVNIFGRQYAGKDTQCERLSRDLGGAMFGGGDILRKSDTPEHAMNEIESGNLSPTDVYRAMVTPYFSKSEFAGKPLFLSSVGRMYGEEEVIIKAAQDSGHEIKAVIFLDIDNETVWERYKRGHETGSREARADDQEDAIKRRLELFEESTIPVIDVYRSLGLVIDIDGSQDQDTVYEVVISRLYEKATADVTSV